MYELAALSLTSIAAVAPRDTCAMRVLENAFVWYWMIIYNMGEITIYDEGWSARWVMAA